MRLIREHLCYGEDRRLKVYVLLVHTHIHTHTHTHTHTRTHTHNKLTCKNACASVGIKTSINVCNVAMVYTSLAHIPRGPSLADLAYEISISYLISDFSNVIS